MTKVDEALPPYVPGVVALMRREVEKRWPGAESLGNSCPNFRAPDGTTIMVVVELGGNSKHINLDPEWAKADEVLIFRGTADGGVISQATGKQLLAFISQSKPVA